VFVDDISAFAFASKSFAARSIFVIYHLPDIPKGNIKNLMVRNFFFKKLKYAKKIITISPYWHDYVLERGIKSRIIFSCYNEKEIQNVRSKEREGLRNKFGFDKDIIYIYAGQCVPEKGIEEVTYNLQNHHMQVVTSGFKELHIQTMHFFLDPSEYFELMRACDIGIFNSTLNEGWNINAMECILSGTPALIKNHCGMGDLLRISGQIELKMKEIKEQVEYLYNHREKYAGIGWDNLKDFTFNTFKNKWLEVYKEVCNLSNLSSL